MPLYLDSANLGVAGGGYFFIPGGISSGMPSSYLSGIIESYFVY